jgi:threonine/homoserine/homoserine lactone efflux protein
MVYYLTVGILLGFSAGIAPGPLLTLVISETLEHGIGAGIKVALSPLITDVPIILFTFFIFAQFDDFQLMLGIMSMLGGCFVFYLGYESIRTVGGADAKPKESSPRSLGKGILTNFLSPHPYLFWFTVGASTMSSAFAVSVFSPVAFLVSFYVFLVGAKVVLAMLVGKYRSLLRGVAYLYTMRLLGLLLCIFAITLFVEGFELLGVLV